MPHSCAAWGCTNRCTIQTRSRGITFHSFPKANKLRKQWEVALRREGFTASQSSRLCSEHFRQEDFDRTGQTVRIRDGAIPSVFSFSAHLQRPVATRTTLTSKKAQESPSVDCSQPVQETKPLPVPNVDHSYALPTSPGDLRARLSEALARVESLEREKRNAKDRERRAKNMVRGLLEDLRGKNLINEELKERLSVNEKKRKKKGRTCHFQYGGRADVSQQRANTANAASTYICLWFGWATFTLILFVQNGFMMSN